MAICRRNMVTFRQTHCQSHCCPEAGNAPVCLELLNRNADASWLCVVSETVFIHVLYWYDWYDVFSSNTLESQIGARRSTHVTGLLQSMRGK